MPQITFRTSEEFHNTGTRYDNGIACKFLVEQLVALDPDLSIVNVISDTNAAYNAQLSVMGSLNAGFNIYNNGTSLYISAICFNDDGSSISIKAQEQLIGNFLGNYSSGSSDPSWYPYLKVSIVGVDGALKYILFQTTRTKQIPYICYGMFTSEAYAEPQYCCGCPAEILSSIYPTLPVIPFSSTLPRYTRAPNGTTYETISFSSFTDVAGFVLAGYSYALLPGAYYGTSSSKGHLNIKWGGKYNLYMLYDASGPVETRPGETVIVGGTPILSAGYVVVVE